VKLRWPTLPSDRHRGRASAANASGFLLTVLSKARHNIAATPTQSRMHASYKTLALTARKCIVLSELTVDATAIAAYTAFSSIRESSKIPGSAVA